MTARARWSEEAELPVSADRLVPDPEPNSRCNPLRAPATLPLPLLPLALAWAMQLLKLDCARSAEMSRSLMALTQPEGAGMPKKEKRPPIVASKLRMISPRSTWYVLNQGVAPVDAAFFTSEIRI